MDSGLGSVTPLVGQASQFRSQFGQFHQRSEVTSLPRPARSAGFWSVGTYLHSVISLASIFRTWLRTDGIFRCSESSVTQRCCRDSRPSWKRGSIPVHLVYCWPDRPPCAPLSVQASGLSGPVLRVLSLQPDLCCAGPTACVSKRVYNRCKTRDTIFGIFLMNFALQLKKIYRFPNYPPPSQSMLITLSGTMIISCLDNIVQGGGGGGCFTWYLNTRKFAKTVKCIIRFATDCSSTASIGSNGLSSSWSPNVHVGHASMSRTSKPRFSVGGVPGLLQPSRLSIEKLSVLRGPHVILCLTGRKCALSWPVSLYWLQFPRLEWWRWGCLLPCPSPCRVVCIRSQGLGWSRVSHKWSMLAGVWAFARALVRSNATCAARTRHPRTWKWRRSSFFPPSSNGMEHRWSDRQHTSFVESLWRSLGVAHSSSLRAVRGHFPSRMERRARGQIPLCWTLALEFPSCSGHAANGTKCDTLFLPDSTLLCARLPLRLRSGSAREPERSTACSGAPAVVKRWRSRCSASGKSCITSWCSRRYPGSVGLVEFSSFGLLGGWFDQGVGPWWWRHTPVASTLDATCSLARSTGEGFRNGYSGAEGDHPPRRSPVSCSRNSR